MRVAISGYGNMGTILLEEIANNDTFELVGVVDYLGNVGVSTFNDLTVIPDMIIDFSHPSVLNDLLSYCKATNCKAVLATTGYSVENLKLIKQTSKNIALLQTGNTSFGISLIQSVLSKVSSLLTEFDVEVIEKHHNLKVDAPSGTAKMLIEAVATKDTQVIFGREGSSKRSKNEIGVHSLRGGTITGEHSVIFAGKDEVIEFKHQALSKRIFATGALKAATFLNKQEKGLYSMESVFEEVL